MVGTIKTNLLGVGDLKKMITMISWQKDKGTMTMTSLTVNTRTSGKQNVLVLATTNPIVGGTKDSSKSKAAYIKFCDYNRGCTDIVNEKMGKYSFEPKSSKWTVAAFSYILDIAHVNAPTLSILNSNKTQKIHKAPLKLGIKDIFKNVTFL